MIIQTKYEDHKYLSYILVVWYSSEDARRIW